MTGVYAAAAALVVLALAVWFVASPGHTTRWRVAVAAAYAATLMLPGWFPGLSLASMLLQVALGVALILRRRWENGPESAF